MLILLFLLNEIIRNVNSDSPFVKIIPDSSIEAKNNMNDVHQKNNEGNIFKKRNHFLLAQKDIPVEELFKMSPVQHPASTILKEDVERAKLNKKESWAPEKINRMKSSADGCINEYKKAGSAANAQFEDYFNDDRLDNMIPITTAASKTFCPHCEATGKTYHPSGTWKWSGGTPDKITCSTCGHVFPDEKNYPESLKYQSQWDKRQWITFVNNGPVTCMNYKICRSSVNGVIRSKKIENVINKLPALAKAYVLTENVDYAKMARKIFLKFAERLPKYLVYCGYSYNEYADCDPHIAVKDLPNLPNPKIAVEPNQRTNTFHSGYWSASRLGQNGDDGELVAMLAESYDLVCDAIDPKTNKPIFSETEKTSVCKNVLIESALLCFYDPEINNKAVMNRKAATIVGLVVGNAKLAHFGLEGFFRTLDEFYLKDGSSSQSMMYGFKTLRGLDGFGQAFRNYTDPDYFEPGPNEVVYKNLDVNHDTNYDLIWQSFIWTTHGSNFKYPSLADNGAGAGFDTDTTEYLAMTYKMPEFQSFVNDIQRRQRRPNDDALFYREPNYNISTVPYKLHDVVFPYLMIGYLRTGTYNRDSVIALDASDYGGHHHIDSLNIAYYKKDRELMSDLGYLVDHPSKSMTQRTNAHNTVIIDGENQRENGRKGSFHLFDTTSDLIKVMQASSYAYNTPKQNCDIYNRTIVQVQHKKANNDYIVDIFRVRGGRKRVESVFHGVNQKYKLNKELVYNQNYEIIKIRGYLEMQFLSIGTTEIAGISIKERFANKTASENKAQKMPTEVKNTTCIAGDKYCFKDVRKNATWAVLNNQDILGKKQSCFQININKNAVNKYQGLFHVGNGFGIKEDDLDLRWGARYEIELLMRGDVYPNRISLHYVNDETGESSFLKWKVTSYSTLDKKEWRKFTGTVDFGTPFAEAEGAITNDPFIATWNITDDYIFKVFAPKRKNQKIFCMKNGWGQRNSDNSDMNVTLPYFYFFRDADAGKDSISTFVQVYEGSERGKNIVNGIEVIDDEKGNVVIKINTNDGIDYVASSFNKTEISGYNIKTDARLAVSTVDQTVVYDGTTYLNTNVKNKLLAHLIKSSNDEKISSGYKGNIMGLGSNKTHGWYEVSPNDIEANKIKTNMKQMIYIHDSTNQTEDQFERPYPIHKITKYNDRIRIYTRSNMIGFFPQYGNEWRITGVKILGVEVNEDVIIESSKDDENPSAGISTSSGATAPTSLDTNSNNEGNSGDEDDGEKNMKKNGISSGGIAGIVIAVIVVVVSAVAGVAYYFKIYKPNNGLGEPDKDVVNLSI